MRGRGGGNTLTEQIRRQTQNWEKFAVYGQKLVMISAVATFKHFDFKNESIHNGGLCSKMDRSVVFPLIFSL